jgi:F-type H+-transporting ATPase subunit delta
MLNKSVARRYAEAFFAIAQERNLIDELQVELLEVADTIANNKDLAAFMGHVLIPPKDKREVVAQLFAGKISDVTLNFLNVVIDKRRANYIAAIAEEYKALADQSRNIVKADVVSAKPVTEQEVAELEKTLSAATGKTVKVSMNIDPNLIGGIKVRIGDRIIDASVVKKLELLKSDLMNVKIS